MVETDCVGLDEVLDKSTFNDARGFPLGCVDQWALNSGPEDLCVVSSAGWKGRGFRIDSLKFVCFH